MTAVQAVLAGYEAAIVIAAGLTADLFLGSWTRGAVTALVIDFGDPAGGSLRDRLARTLSYPSLDVVTGSQSGMATLTRPAGHCTYLARNTSGRSGGSTTRPVRSRCLSTIHPYSTLIDVSKVS